MSTRWLLLLCICSVAWSQNAITDKTKGATRMDGFLPLHWNAKEGKMWLEIPRLDAEFLYFTSLPGGVGSNDIGLDRGQLGEERVVRFERAGNKVLLVQPNYAFRADSQSAEERQAVRDAFAQSVLYGFTIEAEQGGHLLVDATKFFLRDAHGVIKAMTAAKQGAFTLDDSRSAFYMPFTKVFPKNTEVEVTLTFTSATPGQYVQQVAPDPSAVTVRERHSFIELPPAGYRPRTFDPRSGFFFVSYADYATPLGEPMMKRFIARHRLEKKDPQAAMSDPVEPITYYLDRAAPEPVRSALLEGARWWNQAFEAAGYRNAFRVEMLPESADPQDVRYNVIEWVHRATRGWSYGAAITDPRTGEMIKGHVTLGSLRMRQDYMIAEALLAPYEAGKPVNPQMREMVLARLRQLAAHEVGHTLGLAHNYIASTQGRGSVMDYPHPAIDLAGNVPDLSKAYATGIGEWDKVSITYGYGQFAPDQERAALQTLLTKAQQRGLSFITDFDSRATGGAHPASHLWDNGNNAVDELQRVMTIRAKALARFGESNIREGEPYSNLEDVLVPLYLMHRYQVEAASKVLGGLQYTYALRGDGQTVAQIVPAAEQKRALTALLSTIDVQALTLPEKLLQLLPPRAFGYPRTRESFPARTGLTFDPVATAEAAAELTIAQILHPERLARLDEYHSRVTGVPSASDVMSALVGQTWRRAPGVGLAAEVQKRVDDVVLYHLATLARDANVAPGVRSAALFELEQLQTLLAAGMHTDKVHQYGALRQIKSTLNDSRERPVTAPVTAPPGQPI